MKLEPLPEVLIVGQHIIQPRYADDEILEVFKVDLDTGRVWLMRNNGNALIGSLSVDLLRDYDYELVQDPITPHD